MHCRNIYIILHKLAISGLSSQVADAIEFEVNETEFEYWTECQLRDGLHSTDESKVGRNTHPGFHC